MIVKHTCSEFFFSSFLFSFDINHLSCSISLAMTTKAVPNGSAEAPVVSSTLPPVVGINFGNSFASIAVFTKVKDAASGCYDTLILTIHRKDWQSVLLMKMVNAR